MTNLDESTSLYRRTVWPVRVIAGIVFANGLLAILEVLYSHLPRTVEMLAPLDYELFGRLFGLFAGFLLMYFSSQLLLRKRLAWWVAFGGSLVVAFGHAIYVRDIPSLLPPLTSIVLLAYYRDLFVVKFEIQNITQGLRLLLLCLVVALAYGSIGFTRLAPRDFTPPHHVGIVEGAGRTLREFSLFGNDDLSPHSHRAHWFITSLDLLGSLSLAFAFYSLFRPLAYRFSTLPQERARARELIRRFGRSSEDEFKLWPEDKSYFFGPGGQTVVAYRVDHGVAMVLGEPVGPLDQWPALLGAFKDFCQLRDWSVTFIYVTAERLPVLESFGLRALKIGEDAVVNCADFASTTIKSKHFRAIMNKFKRLEYHFEVESSPVSDAVLADAASVTRSWLKINGRQERGFALGYHDRAYLRRSRLFLVRDKRGRLIAFANEITSYNAEQATIDLMRYRPAGESGVMDFLLASIILHVAAEGRAEFSLGLAPMAGMSDEPDRTPEERVIGLAARLGVGGFAFEGLRRFKSKFEPRWEARYLAYERGAAGLGRTLIAVNSLLNGK